MKLKCIAMVFMLFSNAYEGYCDSGMILVSTTSGMKKYSANALTFDECTKDVDVNIKEFGDTLKIKINKDINNTNKEQGIKYKFYTLDRLLRKPTSNPNIKVKILLCDYSGKPTAVNISIFDSINLMCVYEHESSLNYWRVIIYDTKHNGGIGIDAKRIDIAGNVAINDLVVRSSNNYVSNFGNLYTNNCIMISKYIANYGSIYDSREFFSGVQKVNKEKKIKANFKTVLEIIQSTQKNYNEHQSQANKDGLYNEGTILAPFSYIETVDLRNIYLSKKVDVMNWISKKDIVRIGSPVGSPVPSDFSCCFDNLSAALVSVDTEKISINKYGNLTSQSLGNNKLEIREPEENNIVLMSNMLYCQYKQNSNFTEEGHTKVALSEKEYDESLLGDFAFDMNDRLRMNHFLKALFKSGVIKKLKAIGFNVKNNKNIVNKYIELDVRLVSNKRRMYIPIVIKMLGDDIYFYDKQSGLRFNSENMLKIAYQSWTKDPTKHNVFKTVISELITAYTGLSYEDFLSQLKEKNVASEEEIKSIVGNKIQEAIEAYICAEPYLKANKTPQAFSFSIIDQEYGKELNCLIDFLYLIGRFNGNKKIEPRDVAKECMELFSTERYVSISPSVEKNVRRRYNRLSSYIDEESEKKLYEAVADQIKTNIIYAFWGSVWGF